MSNTKSIDAQKAAHKRHDDKRKTAPRLPGTRLGEDESKIMDRLYARFESKSEAIIKAARFYLDNNV
jgi:hypothetical protein